MEGETEQMEVQGYAEWMFESNSSQDCGGSRTRQLGESIYDVVGPGTHRIGVRIIVLR